MYLRGQAYLQLKDGVPAAAQFQSIVDHRGEVPAYILYPLAHLGLARSAAMDGDAEKAMAAFERFLEMWKEADADLEPLRAAKAERARIADARPTATGGASQDR